MTLVLNITMDFVEIEFKKKKNECCFRYIAKTIINRLIQCLRELQCMQLATLHGNNNFELTIYNEEEQRSVTMAI